MDKRLFAHIEAQSPKFNAIVANGLAVKQLEYVEQYIERVIRCAEPGFPEGLRYVRYARCTPKEEYDVVTAKRNNRQSFELAKSDLYLVKYEFEYNGEPLRPRYLYLPYVSDAGLITLLGSTFAISPVLADTAISVGVDSIFIPCNRDKLTFKRLPYHYVMDGQVQKAFVIWGVFHHATKATRNQPAKRRTIDVAATNVHYLFCKYGFTRTFAEFANAEVRVGYEDEINEQNFPPSEWKICHTLGLKPKGLRGSGVYQGPAVKLAIRNEHYNFMTQSMIASFFYIADHFPDRMEPSYVDDEMFWKRLMGHVIFASHESEGKLALKVEDHMDSLDGYVDMMVREWLMDDGVYVNDIYELFMHIVETFSPRVTQSGSELASMYGKRLTVLRYVLLDIIKAIFNMTFALKRNQKKGLSKTEIVNIMNQELKQELIIRINRKHGEVSSISSPSDNKVFKITSNVVLQTNSTGGTRSKAKATVVDPSKILDASIAEVGQFNNLPKSEPSGRSRLNPYVHLGPDGSIERDPKKKDLIDRTQGAIAR